MMDVKIAELKKAIDKSQNICVFTGAGISVPSGIPDFRSANGIYNERYKKNLRPEEIISHSFFLRDPEMFYDFYKSKMIYPEAKPNSAHGYFADLEKSGKNVTVVTQNIDSLHQMAGSTKVYELHGSVYRNYCMNCGEKYGIDNVLSAEGVPRCPKCSGIIRPDVVLYEEGLDNDVVAGAVNAIKNADLMIIVGTSLVVYPAASYVGYFRGDTLALINKTATAYDSNADIAISGDITQVVRELLQPLP